MESGSNTCLHCQNRRCVALKKNSRGLVQSAPLEIVKTCNSIQRASAIQILRAGKDDELTAAGKDAVGEAGVVEHGEGRVQSQRAVCV